MIYYNLYVYKVFNFNLFLIEKLLKFYVTILLTLYNNILQDLLPIIHACPRNQYQTRRYGWENRRRKFFHGRVRSKIEDKEDRRWAGR